MIRFHSLFYELILIKQALKAETSEQLFRLSVDL